MSTTGFSADERERLARVADWFSSHDGLMEFLAKAGFLEVAPYLHGRSCLELGPADGVMTPQLIERFDEVHAVDGSETFARVLAERHADAPGFTVDASLFEDYETDRRFDTVIAAQVLEHVDDPVEVMRRAHTWTADGGRLIVVVPNAQSLHRRAAVHMGLLDSPYELNETDIRLGHRRVYDLAALQGDVRAAGWDVVATGGIFLKALTNGQTEQWFDERMLQGFLALGREMPESCGEIYVVADKR